VCLTKSTEGMTNISSENFVIFSIRSQNLKESEHSCFVYGWATHLHRVKTMRKLMCTGL